MFYNQVSIKQYPRVMSALNFLLFAKRFIVFHINNSALHHQRQIPVVPLLQMHNLHAADVTGRIAALSGLSRAIRVAFVSIQRLAPVFPPAISAVNMQIVQ